MNDVIKHKIKHNTQRFITSMKWIIFSILSGLIIGGIGSAFYGCIKMVTELRMEHLWLLYLLPLGGIVIVGLYRLLKDENDTGTNLVLSAIHSNEEIPLRMAPLIFISTVITHLFGGSAGREGAALQIGGSIGGALGRLFRFNEKDKHIMIMCGMSAAFTALFGTPMAAAVFSCIVLHQTDHLYKKFFPNRYVRIVTGGCIVIALTLLCGNRDYNGSGVAIIEHCMNGEAVVPWAFLLKIIFTAATLGAGYKGGEIVPSFFIGATFGYTFGNLIGFSPSLCTAVGMLSVFCGVTNCPITSLLISFELFGYAGMPFFLLSTALSYMLSGYYGLYLSQKIIYSKYKTEYINRKTH